MARKNKKETIEVDLNESPDEPADGNDESPGEQGDLFPLIEPAHKKTLTRLGNSLLKVREERIPLTAKEVDLVEKIVTACEEAGIRPQNGKLTFPCNGLRFRLKLSKVSVSVRRIKDEEDDE